eukprot:gene18562-24285_t
MNKEIDNNNLKEFKANLLGSSTAGFIGRLICHPIDTAKSRLQSIEFSSYNNTYAILRSTFKEEGFSGLYRGFGIVSVGGIPGTCIYLTVYDTSKDKLKEYKVPSVLAYSCSGIIAEICCCVLFVPVDVIKERLQVQSLSQIKNQILYKGSIDAVNKIWKNEGLRGIYKGYGATVLSYSPFSALYFLLYEETKSFVLPRYSKLTDLNEDNISFSNALICSAFAGSVASYVTSPLDMAKLRLQVQRGGSYTSQIAYTGLYDILSRVYISEGFKGLFRGAMARVLYHAPSTAITMAVFEECKKFWLKRLN